MYIKKTKNGDEIKKIGCVKGIYGDKYYIIYYKKETKRYNVEVKYDIFKGEGVIKMNDFTTQERAQNWVNGVFQVIS